jgi:hypothetical protein
MVVSTSTLLVVLLLVLAASLASYLLSQWISPRNNSRTVGWAGISLGTLLLLAAAVIVVVSISWLPTIRFSGNDRLSEHRIGTERSDGGIRQPEQPGSVREAVPAESLLGATSTGTRRTTGISGENMRENSARDHDEIDALTVATSSPGEEIRAQDLDSIAPVGMRVSYTTTDPWAATRCVRAFHPDPEDLNRWSLENECGLPVGIVFAACAQSPPECDERRSTSWKYPVGGVMLPAKAQRPVTAAEETQHGRQIRHIACIVTTPVAVKLIALDSETRSSTSWLEQFAAAREQDPCLARVRGLADAGRRTGLSIDALLGEALSTSFRQP